MKVKLAVILFVALVISQSFLILNYKGEAQTTDLGTPNLYVGVDVAYENLAATEQTVDKISSFANLLIVGCTGITYNETNLNEICQYTFARNMSFIIYTDSLSAVTQQWIENAKIQYGNRFLGLYLSDELGGRQLDQDTEIVTNALDYADAKMQFVNHINFWLNFFQNQTSHTNLFTSDYALYNFDYQAGYDTVFAEFGWNYSRQLNIALCRGAATAQNKDWGAMITWTYTQPPYMESGPELYNDMIQAYENGAKYIIVFDTNKNYTQTTLKDEHYDAMQQFWQYIQNNPRKNPPLNTRTAYVLPDDYAYAFRGLPEDKIWGLWPADELTTDISMSIATLLQMIGANLDITYPDTSKPISSLGYQLIVYWNDPRLIPPDWPNIPQISYPPETSTPTANPSSSATQTPTPIPSPSTSIQKSTSPSSPVATLQPTNPSPTQATKYPSDPANNSLFPTEYIYWSMAIVTAATVGWIAGLRTKKKKT
jgi:hypothetical protein